MKNHPIIVRSERHERWIAVGLASCALLTGCVENEGDLIADSVVTLETTFMMETGDDGAEDEVDEVDKVDEVDEVAPENDGVGAPSFVPFEAIVKFRNPASSGSRASLLALGQLEALTEDTSVMRFEVDSTRNGVDAVVETWARIDELRAREDVEFAHPNWLFKLSLLPNDTHYAKQWHYPQVNLPAAWDVTTGSPTVRIAVIDSGRTTHPDLASKWVATVEYDAASEDGDARSDSTWNHGVAVAAIAGGASGNGKHSAGVCWGCQLLNVDAGSSAGMVVLSAAIRGIHWSVDNGARVINLSFEASLPCSAPTTDGKDIPALKEAVAYATSKNVTVVAAAGNAAVNASGSSPASCPGVISVAATDQNKTLAAYSNFGQVTLAAPGGAGSLANGKIDPDAQGKALPVSPTGDCGTDPKSGFDNSTKGIVTAWTTSTGTHCDRYIAGTSFAAPHVAGVVGLMLSRNPSLTPAQVKQILESTATKPPCSGCGAGLLDANAAVRAVAPLPVNDPKPTASFTVQCSGLQCSFNGGGSSDNSGIVAYEWILPGQQFRLGKVVDAFMPGYGPKSLQLRVTDNRGQSTLINKGFSMSQPNVTPVAGQYHNPDRPGNRVDIYETSDSGLVVTWYTFDRAGAAVWYTSGAGQRIGARWSQPLYKTTKMNGSMIHTIVGSVSLDFSSSTTAWRKRASWVAAEAATALPRLHAAHVCVVGVGGVGSWVVEGLARSGIGALTLIDLDDVCLTNVNRQLPALDGNIGRPKVTALAERVHLINPGCVVTTVSEYFTAKTAATLLATRYTWVVDCIDLMSNKALLIAECAKRGQPVLTVGSAGGKRDATRIVVTDFGGGHGDELLRQVRKLPAGASSSQPVHVFGLSHLAPQELAVLRAVARTVHSMRSVRASRNATSNAQSSSGSGWQNGISVAVCLAPITPAMIAVAITGPLATANPCARSC